jgi:hypothetical protein
MDKKDLFLKRTEFFNEILDCINKPADEIDHLLNQSKYYVIPDKNSIINSPENGNLAITILGEFFEKDFKIIYTLWQTGNRLKIGISFNDEEIKDSFESDSHKEVNVLWGSSLPHIDYAHGGSFYDWSFDVPQLYESYINQEIYIQGMRHFHFRVMRIIYDKCEKISLQKRKDLLSGNLNDLINTQTM